MEPVAGSLLLCYIEETSIIDTLDLYALHYLFIPRINQQL